MPVINVPSKLSPNLGLPDFAAVHCLTLCDDHLSSKTINLLKHTPEHLEPAGISVWHRILKYPNLPDYENIYIELDADLKLSKMPKDLRDCIILATTNGFNALIFDTYDPDVCPHVPGLTVYR